MPELKLEQISPHELVPPQRRVRKFATEDVLEAVRSIEAFGFAQPVVVGRDGSLILDGELRVAAARWLDLPSIPCIRLAHLTHAEERSLRLALNRIGQRREWDFDELKIELEELILEDQPIQLLGFDGPELDQILSPEADEEPPAPEPLADATPVSKVGDIWELGDHRLICGDACQPETLELLMGDDRAQMMLTDPPWNIRVSDIVSTKHREFAQASGEMSAEQFAVFMRSFLEQANIYLDVGAVELVFIDWRQLGLLLNTAADSKLELLNIICWVKNQPAMGSLWRSQHEMVAAFKKPGGKHKNNIQLGAKGRNRSNCWFAAGAGTIGSEARSMLSEHPTSKPVSLLTEALMDVSDRGDIVLDCFGGSGSTLIAAQKTGRRARLIELDPLYCDVILRRWMDETSEEPIHASSGQNFSQVSLENLEIELETIDASSH
ncbi:hypothetical protein A8B75_19320 [Sphingomonadales bacterium EhC05]|nr:hypothetical protein A8B75_19320 [Sphingomonadales bacterium EhC05]